MKRSLALCLCALSVLGAGAVGAGHQVSMRFHRFRSTSSPCARVARGYLNRSYPTSRGQREVSYSLRLARRRVRVAPAGGDIENLLVDCDGDGSLSDERPVAGRHESEHGRDQWHYGPIRINTPSGGSVQVRLVVYSRRGQMQYGRVYPHGLMGGWLSLGGRKHRFGVVDANFNGRYNDVFEPRSDYDWLAVDLDGDGSIERSTTNPELIPLPRLLKLDDDYHQLEVTADGSVARLTPTLPGFGTLEVGTSDAEIMLLSDTGTYHLRGSGGRWELPAGRYSARDITLRREDDRGNRWELSSGQEGKLTSFQIRPGESASFRVGPPLVLQATVRGSSSRYSIGCALKGRADEVYAPGVKKDGRRQDAPRFKIIAGDGSVLVSDKFEYG